VTRAFVVALLGAESTGKTTLAESIAAAFTSRGVRTAVVDEVLRGFCVEHARTPRRDEQRGIAAEQTRRIEAAAAAAELVIADTTALMIAVYSDLVFGDPSLYADAEAAQGRCDLTLVTALDLPWQPDGLQRDGPQVREPVDALLRNALARAGIAWQRVAGIGAARVDSAITAIDASLRARG
jgi:nicotinamide riboside kinase